MQNIDWTKARQFIFGSLLCFTNNFFETIYFGSVVDSDPKCLAKGEVMVQFDEQNDPIAELLSKNEFIMLETKNLFEAYRHVLQKLKDFDESSLPFKDNLVYGKSEVRVPEYLHPEDVSTIRSLSFPEHSQGMNESQFGSFKDALLSNLSLIQGPPGTGKTYMGLKLIRYLNQHFQRGPSRVSVGPILIVCYTNHALDQFLGQIIEDLGSDKVLRVGGRSKDPTIQDCNLPKVKQRWFARKAFPRELSNQIRLLKDKLYEVESQLVRLYAEMSNLSVAPATLVWNEGIMKPEHRTYMRGMDITEWLKGADFQKPNSQQTMSQRRRRVEAEVKLFCDELETQFILEEVFDLVESCTATFDKLNDAESLDEEDTETYLNKERQLDEDEDILETQRKYKAIYANYLRQLDHELYDDQDHLDDEHIEEFKTVASGKLLKNRLKKTEPLTEEEYKQIGDLRVDYETRLKIYKYWLKKYRETIIYDFYEQRKLYNLLESQKKNLMNREDFLIMRSMDVLGMTTTGAARYGPVLEQLGCRIVVVEEAAEVLEAHTVAALSRYCQQLVLIGDHQQLRPKVDVYELEMDLQLGVSMFERLIVANQCHFHMLLVQHRMHPMIARCVAPIYPNLRDSDSVHQYPASVPGIATPLYFFRHNKPEQSHTDTSYKNDFEADFIAALCKYLIDRGNSSERITVLTFYVGQLYNLSSRLRGQHYKGMRTCVLDNYQGEENDIIILSMVRSNPQDTIGFLKSPNRLCVALSRARNGFYVVGAMDMLMRKISLFHKIVNRFVPAECVGSRLPLTCVQHEAEEEHIGRNQYVASCAADFARPGCPMQCGVKVKCGHLCRNDCHWRKPSHTQYRCEEVVEKTCARGLHKKKLMCHKKTQCEEIIEVQLECHHTTEIRCHQKEEHIVCMDMCNRTIVACRHTCQQMCREECKCMLQVTKTLLCGHKCAMECWQGEDNMKCTSVLLKKLGCGHSIQVQCHKSTDDKLKCIAECEKQLLCDHICMLKCTHNGDFGRCDCKKMIELELGCKHIASVKCIDRDKPHKCREQHKHTFDKCEHTVQYECGSAIPVHCTVLVRRKLECGHKIWLACSTGIVPCTCLCGQLLACRHKCAVVCGECPSKGSTVHAPCLRPCAKPMVCGHFCTAPCHHGWIVCPPCTGTHSSSVPPPTDRLRRNVLEPCKCQVNVQQRKMDRKCFQLICGSCRNKIQQPYNREFLVEYQILLKDVSTKLPAAQNEKYRSIINQIKEWILFKEDQSLQSLLQTFPDNIILYDENYDDFIASIDVFKLTLELSDFFSTKSQLPKRLQKYDDYAGQSVKLLINCFNPQKTIFRNVDSTHLRVELWKLILVIKIFTFTEDVNNSDYALIITDCITLMDTIIGAPFNQVDIPQWQTTFEGISSKVQRKKKATKQEEEMVTKILDNDILRAFALLDLSRDEQLKAVKGLIRNCHPDKNPSDKANEAVQKLIKLKKDLEPK